MEKIDLKNGLIIYCHENDYITNKIKSTSNFYEVDLIDKLLSFKNNYRQILDIGANIGNHTLCFASRYPEAEIFSFEPLKENYELLEKNIVENSLENVKLFNKAVSNVEEKIKLKGHVEGNFGTTSFEKGSGDFETIVIDNMKNLKNVDLIKVDVEGFEVFVIDSINNILSTQSPTIMIEVTKDTIVKIITKMAKLDYYLVFIDQNNNLIFEKSLDPNANIAIMAKNIVTSNANLNEAVFVAQSREHYKTIAKKNASKYEYEKNKLLEINDKLLKSNQIIDEYTLKNEKLSLDNITFQDELKKSIELASTYKNSSENYCSKYEYEKSLLQKEKEKNKQLNRSLNDYIYISRTFVNKTYHKKKKYNRVLNKLGITVISYDFVKYIAKYELDAKKWRKERENLISKVKVGYKNKTITKSNGVVYIDKKFEKKSFENIKVASILDEFSYNSFKETCEIKQLSPDNFERELLEFRPDIFLCESAWSGYNPQKKGRPWQGKIYSSVNFKNENRTQLLTILKICNDNGIPTVFWNKEDPTHFEDKVHNFVDTAKLFDYAFTTDSSCVEKYKEEGFEFIGLLPFSTNVDLDDEVEKTNDDVVFFGSWYANHVSRCNDMEEILNLLIENKFNIKIYDRYSEDSDPNHIYPEEFQAYINPSLSQEEVIEFQKGMKYGLNFNTVVDSETMLARRVYELAANRVLVISNYSKALENLLGENCIILPRDIEKLKNLTPKKYNEMVENAYEIVSKQTYFARFKSVLDSIGYPTTISINHIVNINNEEEISKLDLEIEKGDKIYLLLDKGVDKLRDYKLIAKYNSEKIIVLRKEFFTQNQRELYCFSSKINKISQNERKTMVNKGIVKNKDYILVRGKNVI